MRISDWSSDVCSSDLNHNQPCRYHNRGIAQLDNPHIEPIPRSPLMPVCLLAAAAMPAFPASGILRQSDPTRHAGRFPQRSARTESAARFVQLERIWLMDIKRSEEHTSELQSLMRISFAGFFVTQKTNTSE